MFGFGKTRDVITLFHKAASPGSVRIHNLLKQISASSNQTATIDQASDHTEHNKIQRGRFDLEVTESPPTDGQLRSILEFLGKNSASKVVKGATNESEALRKIAENADNFQRPVVVDWENGKAVASEQESEILKLLRGGQKE